MAKKNPIENEEFDMTPIITLTLDNEETLECYVIATFPAGNYEYVALLPCEGEQYDEGEVFLYRFKEENGEPVLGQIETDEEFEIVSEAFDEVLDSMEYDEIVTLDEEEE
ncbi:MAG: DUF1292 domain-containing protein [Lachnospiraceae bacterium]|nr:DUF1292 domain-containing protein [Lachnospiraceae bacterium]